LGQSKPYSDITEADVAEALAQTPPYGWPADEEELVQLFSRMLAILCSGSGQIRSASQGRLFRKGRSAVSPGDEHKARLGTSKHGPLVVGDDEGNGGHS
jgi:hypothetical protein